MLSITPSKKFCIIKSVSAIVEIVSLSIQISHNEVNTHKDDRRPTYSLLYQSSSHLQQVMVENSK